MIRYAGTINGLKKLFPKDIPLTPEQYAELERAMQWPEDIRRYDEERKPTPIFELNQFFNTEEK